MCWQWGISGHSAKDQFASSYRRIASSGLFTKMDKKLTPLNQLSPIKSSSKKYVLVEESRLADLLAFDALLTIERHSLNQQCSRLFIDSHASAAVPLPATRKAIGYYCEQAMFKAREALQRLNGAWAEHCTKHHYNTKPVYMNNSYLSIAPVGERMMKYRLIKAARRAYSQQLEHDTMAYEDTLSYWSTLYGEAQARRNDYEKYFILATRYGAFAEEDFVKTDRPGRKYYTTVTLAARKMQLLWDRYWAMAKLRRYRAVKRLQCVWRMHRAYKHFHPIIRLRLKFSKRCYYIYVIAKWKRHHHICKLVKEAILFYRSNYVGLCFAGWKAETANVKAERNLKLKKLLNQAMNAGLFRTFTRWLQYVKQNKALKRRLRRYLHCPQFDMWVEYVAFQKHLRSLNKAACKVQVHMRRVLAVRRVIKRRAATGTVHHFLRLVVATKRMRSRRTETIREEYSTWKPMELVKRAQKLNEHEKARLSKKQAYVQQIEKQYVLQLQQHLGSKDGHIQLQQLLHHMKAHKGEQEGEHLQGKAALDAIAHSLKRELQSFIRIQEGHNFDLKQPPHIQCYHPRCKMTCASEEQYANHIGLVPCHEGLSAHPQVTYFHRMLRHLKGQEVLRAHWLQLYGLSGLVNVLDLYVALQEWHKLSTHTTAFQAKGMGIYEMYLADTALRKVSCDHSLSNLFETRLSLVTPSANPADQLYRSTHKPTILRSVLGMEGVEYKEFTTAYALKVDVFDEVELHCFHALFQAVLDEQNKAVSPLDSTMEHAPTVLSTDLLQHPTYLAILHEEEVKRAADLAHDYELYRKQLIRIWVKGYQQHANLIIAKANEVLAIVMDQEVQRMYIAIERKAVQEVVHKKHQQQQAHYESQVLVIDEITSWAEEDVLEYVFQFYTTALINAMWEVTDYRKGMLQYIGLLKTNMKRAPGIQEAPNKQADREWFNAFLQSTLSKELALIPLSKDEASATIQALMRRCLAKKRARIAFAKRYKKFYDESYQAYYYFDTVTEQSTWSPPVVFKVLFPNAKW